MTPQLQGRAQSYAAGANEMMRQRRLAAVQSEALFEQDSLTAESLPEPQTRSAFDDRAHNDEVLREAGFDDSEIDALKKSGALG
jgi:crotonobetainyl-CoA:carnitine CoA-transferase CaiB-like acyl-CoA transferase